MKNNNDNNLLIKLFNTVLASLILFVLMISCSPQSKEAYLEDYEAFIDEIGEHYNDYSDEDWKKADEKYKKFSDLWYQKFEDEFTLKEKIILSKYEVQYNYYKVKPQSMDFFNTYLKDDYEKLKEKLKYYSENEMEDDINLILEQAKEIGDSTFNVVMQAIDDLDIEIKYKEKE